MKRPGFRVLFCLRWMCIAIGVLGCCPAHGAIDAVWYTFNAANADAFWEKVRHGFSPAEEEEARQQRKEINDLRKRLGVLEKNVSYGLQEVYCLREVHRGNIDADRQIFFALPSAFWSVARGIHPCAVKLLGRENLWLHPYDMPSGPASSGRCIALPEGFLIRNYCPAPANRNEVLNIASFQNGKGFTSLVFWPPLSGKALPEILVLRTRIWISTTPTERSVQKINPDLKIAAVGESIRGAASAAPRASQRAPSGNGLKMHHSYLAVLRSLQDLQSRDASEALRHSVTIPDTFDALHPGEEDLVPVRQLRWELQRRKLEALITGYLARLRDYAGKSDPTSADITQLQNQAFQFAWDVKKCVIATGILKEYRDLLSSTSDGNMGPNEKWRKLASFGEYVPAETASEYAEYGLKMNDIPELVRILGVPVLVLGKTEIADVMGKFFPLSGAPRTFPSNDTGRDALGKFIRDNPATIKIYNAGDGVLEAILTPPDPAPDPSAAPTDA